MPHNPLEALRHATGIGPDPNMEVVEQGMPLGLPVGPLTAPVKALINMLRQGRKGLSAAPEIALEAERIGGLVPRRAPITAPRGFEFAGIGKEAYSGRNPALIDKFVKQRNVLDPKPRSTSQGINPSGPPSFRKGVSGSGSSRARSSSINPSLVKAIRALQASGAPTSKIRAEYPDLKPSTINGILRNDTWSWVK